MSAGSRMPENPPPVAVSAPTQSSNGTGSSTSRTSPSAMTIALSARNTAVDPARVQRVLWASTSTKNPAYPDLKYVDFLIGPHTVNTVPQPTLEAILDHVVITEALSEGMGEAEAQLEALKRAGIDMHAVGVKLEADGVALFAKSYDDLLAAIEKKASAVA